MQKVGLLSLLLHLALSCLEYFSFYKCRFIYVSLLSCVFYLGVDVMILSLYLTLLFNLVTLLCVRRCWRVRATQRIQLPVLSQLTVSCFGLLTTPLLPRSPSR